MADSPGQQDASSPRQSGAYLAKICRQPVYNGLVHDYPKGGWEAQESTLELGQGLCGLCHLTQLKQQPHPGTEQDWCLHGTIAGSPLT